MKALLKLAVCGLLAVAVTTQANAQGAAQVSNVLKTQAGRTYLAQMNITAATPAAEVANILKGLSAAEAAAVSRAINLFNARYVANNPAANEAAANNVFKPNGQLLVVVAANSATTSRDGVNTAVQGPSCSITDLANKLSAGTKISALNAEAALKFWGSRITIGTCQADAGGLVSYNASARENFLEAAILGMDKLQRMGDYSGVSLKETWAEMLAIAKSNDAGAVATNAAQERGTVDSLQNSCGILALPN